MCFVWVTGASGDLEKVSTVMGSQIGLRGYETSWEKKMKTNDIIWDYFWFPHRRYSVKYSIFNSLFILSPHQIGLLGF